MTSEYGTMDGELSPRVMVVDDDDRLRRTLVHALEHAGFDVIEANDGAPALQLAARTPPDIAVVDLEMPSNGYDLVYNLKRGQGPAIHVTILSGNDEEGARLRAFDVGADDFVAKPVSMPELLKRIRAAARSQRAYVQARLAQERADRLLAYSAEVAALLAHDLNNGLSVATSNVSYLSKTLRLQGDQLDALSATAFVLRRMAGLVNNFVDIARLEDLELQPKRDQVRVAELLHDVVAIHAPSQRGARWEVACDPTLVASFDRALIERVLHNLVGNATRYATEDGRIAVVALRDVSGATPALELAVTNSGRNIESDVRQTLFTKYGRRDGKGQRGMGLYFCRLVCEAHGGTIAEQPTPTGPRFSVRLPQV